MTPKKIAAPVPRIALTIPEAAAALGMGVTLFNEQVRADLKLIRRGRYVGVPVTELVRWADDNAEHTT